ncbi:MAG TPA: DUF4266 domain-containing protein [Polyangiaceae bacterium]|jgi:hypothetical protein|nr:DUF4266 domain-containing protein [Polyangiaceae bacterium]
MQPGPRRRKRQPERSILTPGRSSSARELGSSLAVRLAFAVVVFGVAVGASGCATVRPEERAILADPKMRFLGDPRSAAQLEHAVENREGSFGGGTVEGGGCGCN